jgi:hypothetical protein
MLLLVSFLLLLHFLSFQFPFLTPTIAAVAADYKQARLQQLEPNSNQNRTAVGQLAS